MQRALSKVFGTRNDRVIKRILPLVERIAPLEPGLARLSDADAARDDRRASASGSSRASPSTTCCPRPSRRCARPPSAPSAAPLRRPADRRRRAASGLDRRDEDRRGQDPGGAARPPISTRFRGSASTSSRSTTTWPGATPSGWAQVHRFLGLSVGHDRPRPDATPSASAAYGADITYCTNNELGFDYLRDNMKFSVDSCVQRELELRDRRRGRLDPDRRGAHAADHLRSLRGEHPALRDRQPRDPEPAGRAPRASPPRASRRPATTGWTRRPTARPSPRRASTRSRRCSASRTSTTRRCCPCCTR